MEVTASLDEQSIASSSNDGSSFAGFLAYLQTPEGSPPPEKKNTPTTTNKDTDKNGTAAADTSSDEFPPTTSTNNNNINNPKPPLLALPSYYVDSFHEHFFPHSEDEEDGQPTRKKLSMPQRYAMSMARKPWVHLSIAFVIAVILSFLGLRFGNFKVAIDNAGWWSRGTLIANRATQETIVAQNRQDLFYDTTGEVWEELQTNVQPNWQGTRDEAEEEESEEVDENTLTNVCSGEWYGSMDMLRGKEKNLNVIWKTKDAESKNPNMSLLDAESLYEQCVAEENTLSSLESTDSCYKCGGEDTGKCIDAYSLVLMARLHLVNNDSSQFQQSTPSDALSCDALRSSWTSDIQEQFTTSLKECVSLSILMSSDNANITEAIIDSKLSCPFPFNFLTTMVDESFSTSDPPMVRYSSSFYATKNSKSNVEEMYNANENGKYDKADGNPLSGVYDTTDEDFYDYYSDSIVGRDMALAVGSAGVTIIAMVVHTKSPWLTLMGLFQILLSFPLAYFVYYFIGGLVFFPFLNFIGIFVVFALGADDVFVAVDKWKNARHELPHGSTEQVAALALPDAAYAMLLTSATTAAAFFATAICPVGPIVCFAVFCGLLISFDYVMNILLVFPALCLYDKWLLAGSKNCCVNFEWCCGKKKKTDSEVSDIAQVDASTPKSTEMTSNRKDVEEQTSIEDTTKQIDVGESVITFASGRERIELEDENAEREELLMEEHQTLIHRVLDGYYKFLHKFRWFVLLIVIAGIITCTIFATQLSLPTSSEVSLLPDGNEYQQHATWTQSLLSTELFKDAGTEATILWGVTPADTGDHLNPDSWTTLVLDETFDPKSAEAQTYLLGFCSRLFDEFGKVKEDYQCPMNLFDEWLKEQSRSVTPTDTYSQSCNEATAVPVPSNDFHQCIISWSKLTNNTSVLQTDGRVKIMEVRAQSDVAYDAPFNELKEEWSSYEVWLDNERSASPKSVNKVYQSDIAFWWYDTNQQMLKTAYGAAAIALVCAAVVIFVSSRSFVLTIFAAVSIIYVLVAATACLVGLGWELGFLESILFAILIGISCDFVIHTGHAYTMYPGDVNRHYRSHFALTHMGPSILAAAFTTFAAAVVMIFTEITFFRKFAVILFMTIVHSVIGCFIVFLVLCDCFGPSEPTKGYETIKEKLLNLCGKNKTDR